MQTRRGTNAQKEQVSCEECGQVLMLYWRSQVDMKLLSASPLAEDLDEYLDEQEESHARQMRVLKTEMNDLKKAKTELKHALEEVKQICKKVL